MKFQKNQNTWGWRLLALVMVLALSFSMSAQNIVSGELTGVVTDAKGSIVTSATVTLTSAATGSSQTVTVNQSGSYRFPLLAPGTYRVSVSSANFETTSRDVNISVGQVTTAPVQMAVKGSKTTVEVTAEAPLLKTEDANLTTTYEQKQIDVLPIPGQDLTTFALTAPGVTLSTGGGYGNFTAFGLPGTSNLFTIDGNDQNDPYLNLNNSGASNLLLGAGSVQEVSVVSNGYTAQYGRQAGAQVNIVSKSGSNQFHGMGQWFWNGSMLNANDWFSNEFNAPRAHAVSNQWAGNIGGPIKKDKLFFFYDYEGLRYVLPGGGQTFVPTPAFAAYVNANIAANAPSESAAYTALFNLYKNAPGSGAAQPLPLHVAGSTDTNDGGCGSFLGTAGFGLSTGSACSAQYQSAVNNLNTEALTTVKMDWKPTQKDSFSFRWKRDRGVQATSTDPINSAFNANSIQPEDDGEMNYTRILNNHMVNQLIASGLYYSAIFGIPNVAAAKALFPVTVGFNDGSFTSLGGFLNGSQGRNVTQWQIVDDFSWQHGNHAFKFGVNLRRNDTTDLSALSNTAGAVTFNTLGDFVAGNLGPDSTYNVSFPNNGSEQSIAVYSLGVYAQDEWRASSKLKLTLALRVERNSDEVCQQNCFSRMAGDFVTAANHSIASPYNSVVLTGVHQAFPGLQAAVYEPRIGFAYTPFGDNKTVIRGGFGIFADLYPGFLASRFITNFPNVYAASIGNGNGPSGLLWVPSVAGSAQTQAQGADNAFKNAFASGGTVASITATLNGLGLGFSAPNLSTVANNIKNPTYYEWNLEVQHSFGSRTNLSVNYVGNHGTNEFITNRDLNSFYTPAASCVGAAAVSCLAPGFGGLPATALDPRFHQITQISTIGHSNYDGLTTSVSQRFTKGFNGSFNYTWSHSLDTLSNGGVGENYSFATTGSSLSRQIGLVSLDSLNYGNSDYDFRHNANAQFTWDLPFKSGNANTNALVSGWQIGSVTHARSGEPFSVLNTSLGAKVGGGTIYVVSDYLGGGEASCSNPGTLANPTYCLTASQFSGNATTSVNAGTATGTKYYNQTNLGNIGRNQFRGPMYFDTDLSLYKSFIVFGENKKLTFGVVAYNVLNHPNFAPPVSSITAGSLFGQIQSVVIPSTSPYGSFQGAVVSGRVMQTMIKFTF